MSVTPLPNPSPRPLAAIVQNVVAQAACNKADRDALIKAHRHAAAFHEAMSEALSAERDIEDETAEFGHADSYWSMKYRESVGKAVEAMNKMPIVWAAVLNVKVGDKNV